mmetsp:Transcript_19307/g.35568  ORF Transcript_19307/g.35568 Transcript_19307/m.35568 type:complete len:247 (-) Transcript_19307:26-766(-)
MGDCSSRPTADRVQSHIKAKSSRHDSKFYYEPVLPSYIDALSFHPSQDVIVQEEMRVQLAKLQLDINKLVASKEHFKTHKDYGKRSVVLVEVQKGTDLYFDTLCLNEPKPIVEVSVEPYGDKLETYAGDNIIPAWFSFFSLDVHPSSEKLIFKVVCERNLGGRIKLGEFEAPLAELRDNKIRDDWFPLSSKKNFGPDEVPRLKLRFQFVHSISQLMAQHAMMCDEAILTLTSAHERMKDVLASLAY